jgi:putative membrane protein
MMKCFKTVFERKLMTNATDFTFWSWMLWVGFIFLLFSGLGNWGYTYRAHRRYLDFSPDKDALDHLSERYAKGEINQSEFSRMSGELVIARVDFDRTTTSKTSKPVPLYS